MSENNSFTILIVDETEASRCRRQPGAATGSVRDSGSPNRGGSLAAGVRAAGPDNPQREPAGHERLRGLPADQGEPRHGLHARAPFVGQLRPWRGPDGGVGERRGRLSYLSLEPRELVATVQALLRVREAERAAQRQRELLRVTLSNIGDGVVATDADRASHIHQPGGPGPDRLGRGRRRQAVAATSSRSSMRETGQPPEEHPVDVAIRSGRRAAWPTMSYCCLGTADGGPWTTPPLRSGTTRADSSVSSSCSAS